MTEDLSKNLDPRIVLNYLNEIGIKNVTAQQLKQFMTDLKKLIRYDVQHNISSKSHSFPNINIPYREGPERLYACSTFSSRSKSVKFPCDKFKKDTLKLKHTHAHNQEVVKDKNSTILPHKSKPVNFQSEKVTVKPNENIKARKMKSSANFIKIPVEGKPKKSDPVLLYHYYTSLWEKYKPNLPGENSWADIRWSIREKLLGNKEIQNRKILKSPTEETLAERRENWID